MKVTVADCLELDAFAKAKVVAAKVNLTNEVKSISVLDASSEDELCFYEGDKTEILLTGFAGVQEDADAQCRILHHIATRGYAALAVYHSGGLSPKLIEAAEREMMPLIQMPKDAGYSQAISEVMDRVLYGDNFRNTLISNTVFHLLNFEKHSNFQSAVREAAISNDFQLIILSEDFNPILTVETRHKATIADAIKLGKERNVESDAKAYTMIDVNGVLTYWGPVTINNEKYYMFIVDNEDSYTAGEITKLAEIIELAMGMWKYTPERDAKAEFIKALMRGNKSLAYTLKDEARISGDDILSVFFSKGISTEVESQVFSEFEKQEDLNIMKITEGDETYGMILTYEDKVAGTDLKTAVCSFSTGSRAIRVRGSSMSLVSMGSKVREMHIVLSAKAGPSCRVYSLTNGFLPNMN
ncbi:MAG: PucR family transcriptional regulator ligand-binding domain-containing protein [Clostridia bacterium]